MMPAVPSPATRAPRTAPNRLCVLDLNLLNPGRASDAELLNQALATRLAAIKPGNFQPAASAPPPIEQFRIRGAQPRLPDRIPLIPA
jgi:hypothetical protein